MHMKTDGTPATGWRLTYTINPESSVTTTTTTEKPSVLLLDSDATTTIMGLLSLFAYFMIYALLALGT